jgi:hypothetical protein
MSPQYWKEMQAIAAKGVIQNFTPYPEQIRFNQRQKTSA